MPTEETMHNRIKTDKANQTAALEITKDDLEKIIISLHNMAEKLQRNLLENLPFKESARARLDDYKELGENIEDPESNLANIH
jgi:hypothetical protein